jgi:hypothetical protein
MVQRPGPLSQSLLALFVNGHDHNVCARIALCPVQIVGGSLLCRAKEPYPLHQDKKERNGKADPCGLSQSLP